MGRNPVIAAMVWAALAVPPLVAGCSATREQPTEPEERTVGSDSGESAVTRQELDGLTRAFADRYVGRVYSAVDGIRRDNDDASERFRAQTLLTDLATNVYDIASNADTFVCMLDLLVVTSLAERVWVENGRAERVFGDRAEPLIDALRQGSQAARSLADRVLDESQMAEVRSIIDDWAEDNPEFDRVSFIRFRDFAADRGTTDASSLLQSGGLIPGLSEAEESVDEARRVAERVFFRAKQESTLLRWQAIAVKEDLFATPEYAQTLDDIGGLTETIEGIPEMISEQREALLGGLDERFEQANSTIDNARAAIDEASALAESLNGFTASIQDASRSVGDTLQAARELASDLRQQGGDGSSFDLKQYEQAAEQTTRAADRVEEAISSANTLFTSADAQEGAGEVGDALTLGLDDSIDHAATEGEDLADALFWRGVILLGLLLVVLVLYRLIAILLTNRLDRSRRERRPHRNDGVHAR